MKKPLKCLLGFHEWDKPEYSHFTIIRRCKRCGAKKEKLIPFDVLFNCLMLEILKSAACLAILFSQGPNAAKAFLEAWEKELIGNTKQERSEKP